MGYGLLLTMLDIIHFACSPLPPDDKRTEKPAGLQQQIIGNSSVEREGGGALSSRQQTDGWREPGTEDDDTPTSDNNLFSRYG